jgi:DMSO/TMAO reductase YedYZ molybdopterin-dependent catalytic subunit
LDGEAALEAGAQHVQFEGLDRDESNWYGASIPLETALNPLSDIILAYEMNSTELPADHGYPLRVIIPGTVGARNVKWLTKISLSNEESRYEKDLPICLLIRRSATDPTGNATTIKASMCQSIGTMLISKVHRAFKSYLSPRPYAYLNMRELFSQTRTVSLQLRAMRGVEVDGGSYASTFPWTEGRSGLLQICGGRNNHGIVHGLGLNGMFKRH